jgi:hypothetical protein
MLLTRSPLAQVNVCCSLDSNRFADKSRLVVIPSNTPSGQTAVAWLGWPKDIKTAVFPTMPLAKTQPQFGNGLAADKRLLILEPSSRISASHLPFGRPIDAKVQQSSQ